MKKVLIYATGRQGAQESLQLDESIEQYKQGNKVLFLHCDESMGGCNENPLFDKKKCQLCKYLQAKLRKKYLPQNIEIHSVSEYVTSSMLKESIKSFSFTTSEELKNLVYHGVEIGMGALSTYISLTRNMSPLIDKNSRPYFDKLLAQQVLLTLVIDKLQSKYKFNKFIFHNGRFAQYKPLLNIAQRDNIDFLCTESQKDAWGHIKKNYFLNDIPHSITTNTKRYEETWEKANGIERHSLGHEFFLRKKNAQSTGDKVYTIAQQKGLLVNSWDSSKDNIVIFNSSEDEFCAISKNYDKDKFFSTQLEGIKIILTHYKNDETKQFYLRIHPNLAGIPYKYHTDLLKLNFPNLKVIPSKSPVSTYTLIDNADKIIVFGSTVGIEAVYWKKPVICLGPAFYNEMGIVYIPKNEFSLWKLLDTHNLPSLYNENVLKYGFYYMALFQSKILGECKNIDNHVITHKFFKKSLTVYAHEKLLGSNWVYMGIRCLINRLCELFPSSFKFIPQKEA